jgi:hypothetical protein
MMSKSLMKTLFDRLWKIFRIIYVLVRYFLIDIRLKATFPKFLIHK